MAVFHSQKSRLIVHQLRKTFHRAAAVDSQRHRRIVAAAQHQAVKQLLNRQHFPFLQVHGRAFDANSFLRNPHPIQHIALLTDDQGRHNFGSAGDQALLLRIFLINHPSGQRIQHDCSLRRYGPGFHRKKRDGGQQRSRRPGDPSFVHNPHPRIACPEQKNVILPFCPLPNCI